MIFEADWTDATACKAYAKTCLDRWGRVDFLHNNVGIGDDLDTMPEELSGEVFDRTLSVNVKGCLFSCQAVIPEMRRQHSGSIVSISSIAALIDTRPITAYKISKNALNALGQSLALSNARYDVRVNTIMPGFLDTPIAIERIARLRNVSREQVRADRNKRVPLRSKMGTAWDIAYASVFLHSDEADFITGVALPVDGGQTARIG